MAAEKAKPHRAHQRLTHGEHEEANRHETDDDGVEEDVAKAAHPPSLDSCVIPGERPRPE